MGRATTIGGIVDIVGIYAYECRSSFCEIFCRFGGDERMSSVGILISSPAHVPTSVKEYRLVFQIQVFQCRWRDRAFRRTVAAHDDAFAVSERTQVQFRKILAF